MTAFVGFLRAVNVGGTGKLPMSDLRDLCVGLGFKGVRTHIASGNVVFESDLDEAVVKARLEGALADYAGKPVGVMVRTGPELAQILAANPFPHAAPNRTVVIFLDSPPGPEGLLGIRGQASEEVAIGTREIYVHYPAGQADTKLKIPAARSGTGRNLNTVAKLAEMAAG
jgi:uncharacterized protein (DUF1697 family)